MIKEALTPAPFIFMSLSPGARWYISGPVPQMHTVYPVKRLTLRISSGETGSVNLKQSK